MQRPPTKISVENYWNYSAWVANYSEDDVKECARAFTGWTKTQTIPRYPGGFYPSEFVYKPEDHDDGIKTFLGKTGTFNGEDIIDIIVQHPATAKFVATEIYDFFVADDPSEEHIDQLANKFKECDYVIGEVLRFLFYSDLFKQSLFEKVKIVQENMNELNQEDARLTEKYYKSFVRNGAFLNEKRKEKILKKQERIVIMVYLIFYKQFI